VSPHARLSEFAAPKAVPYALRLGPLLHAVRLWPEHQLCLRGDGASGQQPVLVSQKPVEKELLHFHVSPPGLANARGDQDSARSWFCTPRHQTG